MSVTRRTPGNSCALGRSRRKKHALAPDRRAFNIAGYAVTLDQCGTIGAMISAINLIVFPPNDTGMRIDTAHCGPSFPVMHAIAVPNLETYLAIFRAVDPRRAIEPVKLTLPVPGFMRRHVGFGIEKDESRAIGSMVVACLSPFFAEYLAGCRIETAIGWSIGAVDQAVLSPGFLIGSTVKCPSDGYFVVLLKSNFIHAASNARGQSVIFL
ncbi:MAG: hypothetical protein AB7I34_05285 [Rhizobiaceae bacterium]